VAAHDEWYSVDCSTVESLGIPAHDPDRRALRRGLAGLRYEFDGAVTVHR